MTDIITAARARLASAEAQLCEAHQNLTALQGRQAGQSADAAAWHRDAAAGADVALAPPVIDHRIGPRIEAVQGRVADLTAKVEQARGALRRAQLDALDARRTEAFAEFERAGNALRAAAVRLFAIDVALQSYGVSSRLAPQAARLCVPGVDAASTALLDDVGMRWQAADLHAGGAVRREELRLRAECPELFPVK